MKRALAVAFLGLGAIVQGGLTRETSAAPGEGGVPSPFLLPATASISDALDELETSIDAGAPSDVDDFGTASGALDGEIAVDYLFAHSDQVVPEGGEEAAWSAEELGMRLRLHGSEIDRRLSVDIDYHGREPITQEVANSRLRLFYRAEVGYEILEKRLTLGAGRFIAPSVALLPVDGVRAALRIGAFTLMPFAGRRAITTSRRNVGFDRFLPAAGASAAFSSARVNGDVAIAYSRDIALLFKGNFDERPEPFDAWTGYARAATTPFESLIAGAQLAFAQRAGYVLGDTLTQFNLEVRALDLWNVLAFLDWRPLPALRFNYDLQTQRAGVFDDAMGDPLEERRFTDNTLKASWRAAEVGWLRAEVRLRLRPDRQERRIAGIVDLDDLGLYGIFVRGRAAYEDVSFGMPEGEPDLDRFLWSASAGLREGGLDLEAGASYIERRAGPLSSRIGDTDANERPTAPDDLAPFVLESVRIAFLRAFYAADLWFMGLDAEQNLEDGRERRFLLQLGVLVEEAW